MWRWCSRSSASGGCAPASRRCSTAVSSRRRRCAGSWRRGPRDLTAARGVPAAPPSGCATACRQRAAAASTRFWRTARSRHPQFAMLAADMRAAVRAADRPRRSRRARRRRRSAALIDRLRALLPDAGRRAARRARSRAPASTPTTARRDDAWKRHRAAAAAIAPAVAEAIRAFRRDLNVVHVARRLADLRGRAAAVPAHARGARAARFLRRARARGRAAEGHGRVRARAASGSRRAIATCSSTSSRTRAARSGSSCAQLVRSWGEGFGAAADAIPPSIFIVGDRKQSIYGFRDADVAVLDEAAAFVDALRPDGDRRGRRSPSASARRRRCWRSSTTCSRPIVDGDASDGARRDAFRYGDTRSVSGPPTRRAPASSAGPADDPALGSSSATPCSTPPSAVGGRDRPAAVGRRPCATGRRASRATPAPADIAILFRSRDSHREFEAALERRGVSTYVYKGLGFFDADEMQDAVALLRYLADPLSDLRAATFLRSRVVRLSDAGVARLGAASADAILGAEPPPALAAARRRGSRACSSGCARAVPRWLVVGRSADAVRAARRGPARDGVRLRAARAAAPAGAREPEEAARHDPPRPEPRLRDARAHRRSPRAARGRRRVERRDRRGRRRQPDDRARGQGARVPDRLRRQHGTRHRRRRARRSASTDDAAGEASVAIADYQSEADEDAQAREREETEAAALRRADARARSALSVGDGEGRRVPDGAGQPRRGAAGGRARAVRRARPRARAIGRAARPTRERAAPQTPAPLDDFAPPSMRTVRPTAGRCASALALRFADQDDRTVGLAAAVAADPGDPVRAARFGVDLIRAGAGGHLTSESIRFRPISRRSAVFGPIYIASGPDHFIESKG